jgi:hypothetical protein
MDTIVPKPMPPKKREPSAETLKMQQDIRALTNALLDDENTVLETPEPVVVEKPAVVRPKKPYHPDPHLTARPFKDNAELHALQVRMNAQKRNTKTKEKN